MHFNHILRMARQILGEKQMRIWRLSLHVMAALIQDHRQPNNRIIALKIVQALIDVLCYLR